jgi:adenylate kinase family enzyme
MVLDGLARRPHEAPILDSAIKFYKREKPFVISIEIPREVSAERLRNRKRADDTNLDIERRLDWYDQNVVPSIQFFKDNPDYNFVSINGERSIEEVHADIISKTIGL